MRHSKKSRALMEQSGHAGWMAIQDADFGLAEKSYRQAAQIAHSLQDLQAEAVFLSYLATIQAETGNPAEAQEMFSRCVAIAQENQFFKVAAHAQCLQGELKQKSGERTEAIAHYLKALEASLNAEDDLSVETAFGNLGLLYLEQGEPEKASECFRQALLLGPSSANRDVWLGSLGQSLAALGQLDEALDYYQQAFAEAERLGNLRAQATSRGSFGNVLYEQGDLEKATQAYQEALELSAQAKDRVREGIWLGNLGNVYRKQGDIALALKYCKKALAVARALQDKLAEAAHLDSVGDCYLQQGKLERSEKHYEQALSLSRSIGDRQGERIYLSNLATVHRRLGRLESAFDLLAQAINLFDEERSQIKSDDLKTAFANRGQDLYGDMVKLCLDLGRRIEALEYVGRAKSRAILDLLHNSPIDISDLSQSDDDSIKELILQEGHLRAQIESLNRLLWQSPDIDRKSRGGQASRPETAKSIYGQWHQVIEQLRRRHPNYASLITVTSLNFDEVKRLWGSSANSLGSDVGVLEFFWTDNYLLTAGLWKGAAQPVINLVHQPEDLAELTADLTDFLEMSSTEGFEVPLAPARRLYDRLLQPLLSSLPETISRLILVPHGSLHRLPFAALHDGDRFLIERFALSSLPTLSLIPMLGRQRAHNTSENPGYLVSAISDYSETRAADHRVSTSPVRSAGLQDLTHTLDEGQSVFSLAQSGAAPARLLTNKEVKAALPQLFGQFPVVHFAGHALFNQEEPLASGLVLNDGSILSAASILQSNILRTRCGKLLIVSACQTGVNTVTAGGELIGLSRALMYAGMPNLVLSLWEVLDRSTAEIMRDFHKLWQSGKRSIAQALQEAQKRALLSGKPIHTWAPFIHMGID